MKWKCTFKNFGRIHRIDFNLFPTISTSFWFYKQLKSSGFYFQSYINCFHAVMSDPFICLPSLFYLNASLISVPVQKKIFLMIFVPPAIAHTWVTTSM